MDCIFCNQSPTGVCISCLADLPTTEIVKGFGNNNGGPSGGGGNCVRVAGGRGDSGGDDRYRCPGRCGRDHLLNEQKFTCECKLEKLPFKDFFKWPNIYMICPLCKDDKKYKVFRRKTKGKHETRSCICVG